MLKVLANKTLAGMLDYNPKTKEFIFNYSSENSISLTMPYSTKSYVSPYHLHPIFDMSMPEGYLFSLLKNLLIKEHGEMNDFILFKHLSLSIEGYLSYEKEQSKKEKNTFSLEEILSDTDENLFNTLVERFLNQSAIAGVQPKVVAQLEDKVTLSSKEYIVKSFSAEYPHLAENEYFCMRALNHANIITPKFWLSASKKLFVMEKFTYIKESNTFYGFEEFCVLFGFNKEKKYNGSYEKIAKAIQQISTRKKEDLTQFFKMMVMNFLLKNGDAHLKNFGVLYTADKKERFLAPAYDVVNTLIYLPKDKPALTLFGKKTWLSQQEILEFGTKYCLLNEKEALAHFDVCIQAVERLKDEMLFYIKSNNEFKEFGDKFLKIIDFSLEENLKKSYKDISNGIL
jgi:serine/threonine-protein kinase HipA